MPSTPYIHTDSELAVLNKFRKRLEREKYINNYASNYYGSMQLRFTIPGIMITGISSIASFLATSDILTDGTKAGFSIGVGIMTAGATILQSVSSSFGFGARKDAFQKAADSYDDLITKIEFEICNPNEAFTEFCDDLEEAILKIKNDCIFLPPLFVMAKYEAEMAKSRLRLEGSPSKELSFEDMIAAKKRSLAASLKQSVVPPIPADASAILNIQDLEYDESAEPVLFLNSEKAPVDNATHSEA